MARDSAELRTEPGEGYSGRFWLGLVAALVWSAVLLAVYTARSASTVSTVVGVVAAVTPFVALLLGSVGLPRMPPRVIRTIVGGVLAADAVLTVGWGGLALYQANRDIDLRAAAHPSGATDVRDGGPHAAIDLVITEHRDRLRVTLRAEDHNPVTGICTPFTRLTVTPTIGGNSAPAITAGLGEPMLIEVPQGTRDLHLDIAVRNIKGDRNCGVNLAVTTATLENG